MDAGPFRQVVRLDTNEVRRIRKGATEMMERENRRELERMEELGDWRSKKIEGRSPAPFRQVVRHIPLNLNYYVGRPII